MTTPPFAPLGAILKASFVIVAVWTGLCLVGAIGNYSDYLQRGETVSFTWLLWKWWSKHALLMLLTGAVYAFFTLRPGAATSAPAVGAGYLLLSVTYPPLELFYKGWLEFDSLGAALDKALEAGGYEWFGALTWLTLTYIAVAGACNWRQGRLREQAWIKAESDNLRLRLELEQQRLLALRGQLEPHFLFNALNAISALVRTDDKRVALDGIEHLSELLRYALQASERDHVSLAEECQFVADYLALQTLRYGARLQVRIDGGGDAALAGELPPLLLQPLIENALRHDLDCHDGPSDIRLAFTLDGERMIIHVSNPAGALRSANPGLGLGLRHTRARLQLAYGAAAALSTGVRDGRFEVEISMPRHAQAA